MIFSYHVKDVAERFIKKVLKDYPGIQKEVLEEHQFKLFVSLLTVRCNELDTAGYVKSKFALEHFIMSGAGMYMKKHVRKKSGNKVKDVKLRDCVNDETLELS